MTGAIETGIPIPRKVVNPDFDAYRAINDGQSVFFTDRRLAINFNNWLRHEIKRNGVASSTTMRKMDHGWRVWKVAK